MLEVDKLKLKGLEKIPEDTLREQVVDFWKGISLDGDPVGEIEVRLDHILKRTDLVSVKHAPGCIAVHRIWTKHDLINIPEPFWLNNYDLQFLLEHTTGKQQLEQVERS